MRRVRIKRVYEPAEPDDGKRVLVDRLWPRGLSRESARIDAWVRDVAPSDELRRWFRHEAARWEEFRARYHAELDASPDAVAELRECLGRGRGTLVFAAREPSLSNARALLSYLESEDEAGSSG